MPDGLVRVLLIEDDDDDYLLTKELFAQLPPDIYHLDRVADYPSAIHAFQNCHHDVYLVDYRLGQHTGLEIMAEAIRLGCNAPMIMLTGQREREVDLLAMQAGAVDYLVKDQLSVTALERSMRYALQQQRHRDAIRQVNQQLERRVVERTSELEALNEKLQLEIGERKRIEAQLREVDRRKDQFLATLAHELRNPLSPLTSAAQLIGMEPEKTGQVRELTVIITRQLGQLVRLIDDLLDVSRISGGKLKLRKTRVAIGEPIAAALDVSRPLIDEARHQLQVSLPQDLVVVEGDPVRLTQIISNLLINAAKYTPPSGTITLTVKPDIDQVVIRVRDSGVGIPPELQSEIFEIFAQADSSHTRHQGGLGIGLTLVKTLVEMHGGTIEVFSRGDGMGSEFTVRLPLASPASVDSVERSDAPSPIVTGNLPVLRVVVVDDSESAVYLLAKLLEKLGQSVEVAHSAKTALDLVQKFEPHLVISDVGMPDVSGLKLAQQIRSLANLKQPHMVALTGYGQDSDRREILAAGFDEHFTKPIGLSTLEQLISEVGT
ncbi:MAG: response regulator [Pirellulaceae bacterium]